MDKEPDNSQRVVSAKECLSACVASLVIALLASLFGLWLLQSPRGHSSAGLFALLPATEAILMVYCGGKGWKRYVAIKDGAAIYAKRMTHNSEDWIASTIGTLLLYTCISILSTVGCLWLWQLLGKDSLACVSLTGVLWVYTLFCWYRFLFRRPKAALPAEPQEGVWPPPPTRPDGSARG